MSQYLLNYNPRKCFSTNNTNNNNNTLFDENVNNWQPHADADPLYK